MFAEAKHTRNGNRLKPVNITRKPVEFVQDYVQLRFDGPTLTAFVWPVVSFSGKAVHFGESRYRDGIRRDRCFSGLP